MKMTIKYKAIITAAQFEAGKEYDESEVASFVAKYAKFEDQNILEKVEVTVKKEPAKEEVKPTTTKKTTKKVAKK